MNKVQQQVILTSMKDKPKARMSIAYGYADTKFGEIMMGLLNDQNNAICHLHFAQKDKKEKNFNEQILQKQFPRATLIENPTLIQQIAEQLFEKDGAVGLQAAQPAKINTVEVAVSGTAFQKSVWEALLKIPSGKTCTYSELAGMIDKPKAVRPVANAVANNDIAILIPCHRVLPKEGNKFKYRWGGEYKRKLLDYEAAK